MKNTYTQLYGRVKRADKNKEKEIFIDKIEPDHSKDKFQSCGHPNISGECAAINVGTEGFTYSELVDINRRLSSEIVSLWHERHQNIMFKKSVFYRIYKLFKK